MHKFGTKNGKGFARDSKPHNENYSKRNGLSNVFAFNTNHKPNFFQCKKCRSDYSVGAFDGLCIDCLQKAEFMLREHPDIAARAKQQGGAHNGTR